jgi:hypothetical protein
MQLSLRDTSSVGSHQSFFGGLLTELRGAHYQLRIEIAHLDAATCEQHPDAARVATARWRLSQASLQRRRISKMIRDALLPVAAEEVNASLQLLQEADHNLQRKSREHVVAWTSERDRFQRDWLGYCEASRLMRRHMDDYLELEQRILYPLIERTERRGL